MRILIAHDGSQCADAALASLEFAGLPRSGQMLVVTVAETKSSPDADKSLVEEAQNTATAAARRLAPMFPEWEIKTQAPAGAAQATILQAMQIWAPDLVVVGSHGRRGIKRLLLGSVSQHILQHARCSVRIGRAREGTGGPRLLIGTDGSDLAKAAVQSVAAGVWPLGATIRIISVVDARTWLLASMGDPPTTAYTPAIEQRLRTLAAAAIDDAAGRLGKLNLPLSSEIRYGMPGDVLVAEANQIHADCIYLGATGHSALGKILLGSVSTAVTARASCSVEVVRAKPPARA